MCEPRFSFYASLVTPAIVFPECYTILVPAWVALTLVLVRNTYDDCWSRRGVVRLIGIPVVLYAAGAIVDLIVTAFYPWTTCF